MYEKTIGDDMMTRLYIPYFNPEDVVMVPPDQAHHVRHVLRYQVGDELRVFNNEQGEWTARIEKLGKSELLIRLLKKRREVEVCSPVHLIFPLLKHDGLLFLLEKTTELGVSHLHPVITHRTVVHRFNADKALKNTIDATQQCERFAPPQIHPVMSLADKISRWPAENTHQIDNTPVIISFLERREAPSLADVLSSFPAQSTLAFLIGPEGGFTPEEQTWLSTQTKNAHLGPRILRAETAALTAIAAYQLYIGDF